MENNSYLPFRLFFGQTLQQFKRTLTTNRLFRNKIYDNGKYIFCYWINRKLHEVKYWYIRQNVADYFGKP